MYSEVWVERLNNNSNNNNTNHNFHKLNSKSQATLTCVKNLIGLLYFGFSIISSWV